MVVKLLNLMKMIVKNRLLNFKDAYIYQDTEYFKMSLDSLLLANFVTINFRDKKILDIATGNAPIPMLLFYRTKAEIYGIELQKEIYLLGRLSIKENRMTDRIDLINDDAINLPNLFDIESFDVITCNPPYFKTNNEKFENRNKIKALARHEKMLTLDKLIVLSKKMLKNNGRFAMVHRTDRLMEIIDIMKKNHIEPKKIRFIYPNNKKNSDLLLIEGIKNGKPGLKLLPPLFVYDENNKYTKEISDMFGE